jgi:hypothetical protein
MSVDGQLAVNNIVIKKYNQWKEKPQTLILIHKVNIYIINNESKVKTIYI